MAARRVLVLALLLVPCAGLAHAEPVAPEQLLSDKTQLYFRWDGYTAHKATFDKTAFGKMLQGDTGKFVQHGLTLIKDAATSSLTVKGLLEGAPVAKVETIQADIAEASKIVELLVDRGVIVAAELSSANPPAGQLTVIVPDTAKPEPVFAALRLVAALSDMKVEEARIEGRQVSYFTIPLIGAVSWWSEQGHAVVVASTAKPADVIKRMTAANQARLPANPLFKRLQAFKEFTTSMRGFLDAKSVTKALAGFGKETEETITALGFDNLETVTYWSGFEGEASRSLFELATSGQRKGLLALLGGKPFKLADVPPLPADCIGWTMTSFDPGTAFDALTKSFESLLGIFEPNSAAEFKEGLEQLDKLLGVNFRKDILGALGDRLLLYSSPGEGVFLFNLTAAIKVKNPERLLANLDLAVKGLATTAGGNASIKKKKYRGVDVRELHVSEEGFFILPTYALVDGWLVMSFYPQPVQGHILRAKGELPVWKPDESIERALDKLPREVTTLSCSDPRPTVKQLLSLTSVLGGVLRSFMPDLKVDPSLVPNGNEATKHLFPNVTVAQDDGRVLRIHSRTSLAMPIDIVGVDIFFLGFLGAEFFALGF